MKMLPKMFEPWSTVHSMYLQIHTLVAGLHFHASDVFFRALKRAGTTPGLRGFADRGRQGRVCSNLNN